jgi:PPOX class probable F420-dependent enzyme
MPNALLDPRELAFLVTARHAILATIDPTGRPRLVPVCFIVETADSGLLHLVIPLDDKPKATDDKRGLARVRDIERRPEVSLLVEHWDEDWSKLGWLRLNGLATVLEPHDARLLPDVVERLRAKYPQYASHDLESSPMIFVSVKRARNWGALDPT